MANLYQQGCFGDRVYGEEKAQLAVAADLSLKKDHILVGNDSAIAEEVCLDETKFYFIEPIDDCETRMLSILPMDHGELLGLEDDDHLQYVHISEDRIITADHEIQGTLRITNTTPQALQVTGGIGVGSTFYDEEDSGGDPGQIILRTTTGVKWVTPAVENTLYVSKDGNDENSGLSEFDAKASIGSALRAAKSGLLGELQDAGDQILANRELIIDEAWGHLLTATNIVFPNESLISTKARDARKIIYNNRVAIRNAAIAAISATPGYSNAGGKCSRDLDFIIKAFAEDIFAGGHDFIYKVTSAYFKVDGTFISSIFSPDTERTLTITAVNSVRDQINALLVDPIGQAGYYTYLKSEVTRLAGLLTGALTTLSLAGFATEQIRTATKYALYYSTPSIVSDLWDSAILAFPDASGGATQFFPIIEKFLVAMAEDLYGMGTKSTVEFLNTYYTEYTGWRPDVIRFAISEFLADILPTIDNSLDSRLTYLVGVVDASLAIPDPNLVPDTDPGYHRSPTSEVCRRDIGYFVDAVASDLKNGGNSNSVQVGEAYYEGANLVHIDGEVTETLITFDKAREVMIHAMRNWQIDGIPTIYQPVYSFRTIYRDPLIPEWTGGWPSCTNAETAINNYYQIVEFILTNGPNYDRKTAYDTIISNISNITNFVWFETLLISPFASVDSVKCKRDITYLLEALAHDIRSLGNSKTIEATLEYSAIPSVHSVALTVLDIFDGYINAQVLWEIPSVHSDVTFLINILRTAINGGGVPTVDTGTWNVQPPSFKTTIFVRSGEYIEENPIVVPPNTSIFGDNLRSITVYPKNKTQDIFYVNNASYITGITISGHLAPSFAVSFPQKNGVGVAGIITRSPYVQNCTSLSTTGGGMRIDGELSAGLKSMVLDAFTQYNQGGPGIEITNNGYIQLVSLFTICCSVGVKAEKGGQCDLTNSNSSFGVFGLFADGVGALEHTGRIKTDIPAGETEIVISELGVQRPYNGQVVYFGAPYYSVSKINIVDPGDGYITPPTVNISDPTGPLAVPARARAFLQDGKVVEISLLREGRNFITPPTITIDPPPPGGTPAVLELEVVPIYYPIEASTEVVNGEAIVTLSRPLTHDVKEGTSVPFYRQSKILASGQSFEYIGSGANINTALPTKNGTPVVDKETEAINGGSVIFTSTDQRGNFKIGDGVIIDQVTGTIGGVSFSRGLFAQITPLIIALQG